MDESQRLSGAVMGDQPYFLSSRTVPYASLSGMLIISQKQFPERTKGIYSICRPSTQALPPIISSQTGDPSSAPPALPNWSSVLSKSLPLKIVISCYCVPVDRSAHSTAVVHIWVILFPREQSKTVCCVATGTIGVSILPPGDALPKAGTMLPYFLWRFATVRSGSAQRHWKAMWAAVPTSSWAISVRAWKNATPSSSPRPLQACAPMGFHALTQIAQELVGTAAHIA